MRSLWFAVSAAGCGLTDFNIDQHVPTQTVPGSGIPAPLAALFPLPLDLDLNQQIKAMNTGPVNAITLASLELTITSPSDGSADWTFVDSVDVFVESTRSGSTLSKAKIATVASPTGQKMTFSVEGGVNLKPYIDEGSKVDCSGQGRAPAHDVSYDGLGVFTVHLL